jgi:uncharacterized protein YkwD
MLKTSRASGWTIRKATVLIVSMIVLGLAVSFGFTTTALCSDDSSQSQVSENMDEGNGYDAEDKGKDRDNSAWDLGEPWRYTREPFVGDLEDDSARQSLSTHDYGDPTAAEQAHLEALNRARLNPQAEAARLGIDLFEGVAAGAISGLPVQPLTFNAQLLQAARLHSQDMFAQQYFAHQSLDGRSPFDRMQDAGYQFFTAGENLAWRGSTAPLAEVATVLLMHDDLFIDAGIEGRGHRVNILNQNFKEVGIGVASGSYLGYAFGYMVTCDFGASSQETNSFLLGVIYDDQNSDGIYTAGEGVQGVDITAVGSGSQTTTASAGGYSLSLPPGSYTVTATLSDGREASKQVSISSENVKVDFLLSEFTGTSETSSAAITKLDFSGNFGVNNPMTFEVEAVNDCPGDTYFRFDLIPNYGTDDYDPFNNWQIIRDFSDDRTATHTFTQAGSYILIARASCTQSLPTGAAPLFGGAITIGDDVSVRITGLELNLTSTVQTGDDLTFTASAVNDSGGDIYYQFGLVPNYGTDDYDPFNNWQKIRDFSDDNTATHTFTQAGSYILIVWASSTPALSTGAAPLFGGAITVE